MSTEQVLINCADHGEAYATYVCAHLVDDPVQEWFCDYPSEDNPWPDSWEMTSIAAYVLDARGVYRTPGDTGFTFLAISDIRHA